jgi:DNA-binding beta-propeller fold protein YncE
VSKTHAIFVTGDGHTLYATNFTTKELVVLDAKTGGVQWRLGLDGNPSEALVTNDQKFAYVSIRSKDAVAVVDLAKRTVIAEPFIGSQPDTLQLAPDGKRLVVTLRGTPAQISTMEIPSRHVNLVNLAGTTTGHHWLSSNGRYPFVAIEGPGGLAVVDNETGQTKATFAYPGGGKPHGVFFWPSGGDPSSSD